MYDVRYALTKGFNPRICKRCDFWADAGGILAFGFNPRICKRCDYKNQCNDNKSKVSIHASVKDATKVILLQQMLLAFQSTHL